MMQTIPMILALTMFQTQSPSVSQFKKSAVSMVQGQPAPFAGVLFSLDATRRALKCAEVEVPELKALLTQCEDVSAATVEYLQRRAESAESALRLAPRAASPVTVILVGVTVVAVGVLAGFALGTNQ